MTKLPLVSIAVLSYRNTEYLEECLASIFSQTYENIELIVSNDGADEFDREAVESVIAAKAPKNITNLIINKNPRNMGTVAHCNILLDLAGGDYILFMACDDVFHNPQVIWDMVEGFGKFQPDVMSLACQTEMWNDNLSIFLKSYMSKKSQQLINTLTPEELYRNYLVTSALFPAGSRIYKRECFERYGRFDENYYIIEDWSSSMAHAKRGMKTRYMDINALIHRAGGVSHSEPMQKSFAQKMYVLDLIRGYEEALADESISMETLSEVNRKRDWWSRRFFEIWNAGRQPIELLESLNLGAYLSGVCWR